MNKLKEIIKNGLVVTGELKDMPYAPEGITEWVMKTVITHNYIMIGNGNAYCNRCGTTYPADQLQGIDAAYNECEVSHKGLLDRCPYCDEFGAETKHIAFFDRYGKNALTKYARIVYLKTINKKLYAVEIFATIKYSQKPALIQSTIEAIYIIDGANSKKYVKTCDYLNNKTYYTETKTVHVSREYNGFGNITSYTDAAFYLPNAQKEIDKAGIRVNVNEFVKIFGISEKNGAQIITNYIRLYMKWPAVEMLWKYGCQSIVYDIADSERSTGLKIRKKNIREILGVKTFPEAEEIKRLKFNKSDVKSYSEFRKLGYTEFESFYLTQNHPLTKYTEEIIERIKDMLPSFTMKKFIKKYAYSATIIIYKDYLRECVQLEYDLSKKDVAWPKNLIEAHQATSNLIKIKKDEVTAKGIEEVFKKFRHMSYTNNDLTIRPVKSFTELTAEGKSLRHCVAGYADRIASGGTTIFAIRKTDDKKIPYYTLELEPTELRIIQCRGMSNVSMTPEVEAFTKEWLKEIKKNQKKKRRKAA